ncbi:MAG: tetratricopeptide repeat protein, partial [Spirochaetales bacterium]|nr:tetratricopeptide repeat protein [Spirochaetales bacterium]
MDRLYLIHAESLYKTGEISEAEIYYQKILSAEPDISSIAFIRLFSIYKNDTLKQSEIFDKAQVQLSGHPIMLNKFLLRVGIDSYNNGHFELAASYLQRIWRTSDISEINSLVPVYLAKILVSEGDRTGAADILSNYSNSVSSRDELVLYTLSNVLVEDGNWKDAEGYLKDFIFAFPNSEYYSSASWMYAYSLYRSGQFSESKSVIDFVLANGTGGSYTTDFILLSARVFIKLDNIPNAIAMFKEYLPFDNSNTEIWFDIIKLQFIQGDYKAVSGTYQKLIEGSLSDKKSQFMLLIEYIAGLADIAQGQYSEGLDKLSHISKDVMGKAELEDISPYIAYYRGWASYRLSDYRESFTWFKLVADEYSESSVYTEALYFAGWSLYLLGDYSKGANYFADFSALTAGEDKVKGLFYYGKSMYAAGDVNEAEIIFQNIYAEYPHASYADDAVFEHGQILENLGEYKLAIAAYEKLYNRYRTSSLAEESLFKVGELYLLLDMYKEARDAFYLHRLKFPKGVLGDVSLYWGAEAAGEMGEIYGAILLLEKLLAGYPDSSFRPNAIQQIAAFYAEEGEYRKALAFYSDFLANYSESDYAADARTQMKKLNLLQSGVDELEAELLVLIENEGTESKESREAHIELARIYLYKFNGREKEAFGLLNTVASLKDKYPDSAGRAVYYLGDYYFLQKDYTNAANSFIDAATIYPENRDLMAVSLLRASEMAIAAGDRQTAVRMVRLLEI